tara:strand:+ start:451 stop:954 length:504 start_codon:yes stop_codon:yes gene_type:complete
VLTLFKGFVKSQRPGLDIDDVATGETWFGEDAMNKGLCDALQTTDDVLLQLLSDGKEIFSVKYAPPRTGAAALLGGAGAGVGGGGGGWGALRAAALGVAGFAAAAGGDAAGAFAGSSLGLGGGGAGNGNGGVMAVDGERAAEKVMARDGYYAMWDAPYGDDADELVF